MFTDLGLVRLLLVFQIVIINMQELDSVFVSNLVHIWHFYWIMWIKLYKIFVVWYNCVNFVVLQIESVFSLTVSGIGVTAVGACASGQSGCRCCCKDSTTLSENYILVDTKYRSHTGPNLTITSTCNCASRQETQAAKNGNTSVAVNEDMAENLASLTSAVTSVRQPVCQPMWCLNGGRCVPGDDTQPR